MIIKIKLKKTTKNYPFKLKALTIIDSRTVKLVICGSTFN